MAMDMEDLVLERKTVELLQHATNVREIKIINGHKRGTRRTSARGGEVGTTIAEATGAELIALLRGAVDGMGALHGGRKHREATEARAR
jgi:hypothetical protein